MKISHLTRITTVALLLIVILFSAALLWSLQRLDDAFRSSQDYQTLKDNSRTELLDPMRQYLSSGQTVRQSEEVMLLIQQIREAMTRVRDLSTLIAAATEEQSAVSSQVTDSLRENAARALDSSNEAGANQRLARNLNVISQRLDTLASQFR